MSLLLLLCYSEPSLALPMVYAIYPTTWNSVKPCGTPPSAAIMVRCSEAVYTRAIDSSPTSVRCH